MPTPQSPQAHRLATWQQSLLIERKSVNGDELQYNNIQFDVIIVIGSGSQFF
jgi:hypothetical protein